MKGIPLSYVVRANEDPDHETNFEGDFVARSIACAPLNNATFRANARKVHQLLMNFVVAESAEQWIMIQFPPKMVENWLRYGLVS